MGVVILCAGVAKTEAFKPEVDSTQVKRILGEYHGFGVWVEKKSVLKVHFPSLHFDTLFTSGSTPSKLRISPDGQWLVYKIGGTMYLRALAPSSDSIVTPLGPGEDPFWWENPNGGELYLVYCTQSESMLLSPTQPKYPGLTYRRKILNGNWGGSAELLLDQGFKAGLSKDGRWLATADKTPILVDLKKQESFQLSIHRNSTCHPRINPTAQYDKMDQICFVNTLHDSLITKNSRDSVVWAMAFPFSTFGPFANHRKWHANGWSNVEDIMLTNSVDSVGLGDSGEVLRDYFPILVRRSDQAFVRLGRGGLWQDLWLEGAPSIVSIQKKLWPGLRFKRFISHDITGRKKTASREQSKSFQFPF